MTATRVRLIGDEHGERAVAGDGELRLPETVMIIAGLDGRGEIGPMQALVGAGVDLDRRNAAGEEGAGVDQGTGVISAKRAGELKERGAATLLVGVAFAGAGVPFAKSVCRDGREIGEGMALIEAAVELVAGLG